jgi:hypothetical protein
MGDGKIFLGRLDGRLIALDQQTGKVIWDVLAADPAQGYGITAAPLYYNGKVITGFTGGEHAIRGRISAYDAETGEQVWNFYTIPGPGELGHATWPQNNDAWKYGGAPVWQTPSVDPELGMIYFSTGNAGPDLNGAIRAGDNLFAASLVALDVETGENRWHFQVVRHDIWDYDAPNPTVLFDAAFDGMPRKGIAVVSKAGYLYLLDRTTGVPLTPVVETPVPQDRTQATAATQPIPQGDQVIRHDIEVVGENFEGLLRNAGRTFTPFNAELEAIWRVLRRHLAPELVQHRKQSAVYLRGRRSGTRQGRRPERDDRSGARRRDPPLRPRHLRQRARHRHGYSQHAGRDERDQPQGRVAPAARQPLCRDHHDGRRSDLRRALQRSAHGAQQRHGAAALVVSDRRRIHDDGHDLRARGCPVSGRYRRRWRDRRTTE